MMRTELRRFWRQSDVDVCSAGAGSDHSRFHSAFFRTFFIAASMFLSGPAPGASKQGQWRKVRDVTKGARLFPSLGIVAFASIFCSAAYAQAGCESVDVPNAYVPVCATEALAYARATEDAKKYFAENPRNAYGDKNKLCPTVKTRYNGPYVWVASVPSEAFACAEEASGYVNPVFRAQFSPRATTPPDAGEQPFDPGKNNQCAATSGPNMVGNPVNLVTGYKIQSATDFLDPAGHLDFTRHYTSAETAYNPSGSLGFGWRHSFQSMVMVYNGREPRLTRPSGDTYSFKQVGGYLLFDADITDQISALTNSGQATGWLVNAADDRKEFFDIRGRLERVEFKDGDVLSLSYNADNQLIRVSDRRSRALSFAYENGKLVKVMFPDGASVRYTQSDHRLSTVEHWSSQGVPFGSVGYVYEDSRHPEILTGIIDENGDRFAAWSYDQYGRAVSSRHGGVDSAIDLVRLSYQSGQTTVIGALGDAVIHRHKFQLGRGKVYATDKASATCGDRSAQSTTYDQSGYPVQRIDFRGTSSVVQYNARGLLYVEVEAENDTAGSRRTLQTDWHPDFRVPVERRIYSAADALVFKTIWTYNVRGQPTTITAMDPSGGQVRTEFDVYCEAEDVASGRCPMVGAIKERLALGHQTPTSYWYYPDDDAGCAATVVGCSHRKGDLWKVINPAGHPVEYLAYDGAGRVISQKDANGTVTSFQYHPRGWLAETRVHGADGAPDRVTSIEYWPTGLTRRIIQPDGSHVSYRYDAAHRLVEVEDGSGNTIEYVLDNAGNRIAENTRDPAGTLTRTLSRLFNARGELVTQADASANPTDFAYDINGNNTSVTDALGRVTQNEYDPLNRLKRTVQDLGGIGADSQFKYDALDNLTEVTDPKGLKTTYARNGFGEVVTQTSPDTGVTAFTYDSAGNVLTRTDARGVTANYSYDALGRTTAVAFGDPGADIHYVYDQPSAQCAEGERAGIGRIASMIDPSGRTDYCYSAMGDLVRRVQVVDGQALTLRYAYDAAGRMQSMTYPDGSLVDYSYDALGQVSSVGVTPAGGSREVLLHGVQTLPFGPEKTWTFGNGRRLDRSYDLNYLPKSISDARDGLNVAFGVDPVGNITSLTDGGPQVQRATLDYDGMGRLTAFKDAETGVAIEQYSYDATGNRLSFGNSAGIQTYKYLAESHRLTSVDGAVRTYDAMGNTLTIGGEWQYTYDVAGQLSLASRTGSSHVSNVHNGAGQRVLQKSGDESKLHLHGENGEWLGAYGANATPSQQVIWLGSRPVGMIQAGRLLYIESDHLGSPRALLDPQLDATVWRWSLMGEVFGGGPPEEDPDHDGVAQEFSLRFPGQRADPAIGLNYNYYRDYEPQTGRYSRSDPIGLSGGVSTYSYVSSSPLTLIDPQGLYETTVSAFCRQNPGHCVMGATGALAGAAALPKADSMSDSQCDTDDRCRQIVVDMRAAMHEVNRRREEMRIDKCNMYNLARMAPNPALGPSCPGSWDGHGQQIRNWQNRLKKLIEKALANGCYLPSGVFDAAYGGLPSMPRGY